MSVEVFYPLFGLFIFLVLSCMSCLYILETNPLSVVSFAIIFSHSEGLSFHLFPQGSENYFDHIMEKWLLTHNRFSLKLKICCGGKYKQPPGAKY